MTKKLLLFGVIGLVASMATAQNPEIADAVIFYAVACTDTQEDTLNNRGINSFQLLRSEGVWKIASIVWYDETEEYPMPEIYQP